MKKIKYVFLCIAGLLVLYTFFILWKQSQSKATIYQLVTPECRTISEQTMASGTLEPRTKVELKPQVTGIVEEIMVTPGEIINSGDIVARVRVIPDMSMLNQAQSAVESARLDLEEIQREAERSQKLFDQGVVSREENEKYQNNLDKARENFAAANCQVDVITKGFSQRSATLNTTEVRSSMKGTVLDVPVKVGTSVSGSSQYSAGTTIATVGDMRDVIFKGNIDEIDVAKLQTGMKIRLIPGSMPQERIPATLEFIAPEGKTVNGAKVFEMKAAVHIPEDIAVRSGYSVNAEIIINEAENVLSVDETSIFFEDGSPFVYSLTSQPSDSLHQVFERRNVKVGLSDGVFVEVKEGVTKDMKLRGIKK